MNLFFAGFQGVDNIKCVILYPKGKTSRIQELQMTTVQDPNVQCVALEGGAIGGRSSSWDIEDDESVRRNI